MNLKAVRLLLLSAALAAVMAACGGGNQAPGTQIPEAKVVPGVKVEPTPRPPATPHVEPTMTPVSALSDGNGLVISFSPETKARYRVKEQLARLTLPNNAVGVTDAVTGMVTFDVYGNVIPGKSKITINASTLKSDENRRDNRVRKDVLQTNQFPTIDFVVRKALDLTWPLPGSGDDLFRLAGDLVIRDVTKEITWNVRATFTPNRIEGLAETSFTFGNFELDKPTAMFILSVEDLIRLELDFVVTYQ